MTRHGATGGGIWPSDGWRQAVRSVRVQLALLTVALVLITGLAAALVILDSYRAHSKSTELQLTETATALSLAVDGKVRESTGVLKALAASHALAAGDLAAFDREARQAVAGSHRWVMLADDQGRRLLDTALPPGAPLPPTPPNLFQGYHEAPGKDVYVSDIIPNSLTGRPMVGVTMPVLRPGRPTWRLAIGLSPRVPQQIVADLGLPPGWYGALHDRHGTIIARSIDAARYVGRPALPDLLDHILRPQTSTGVFEGRAIDGRPILAAYKRSPLTGWTLMVAMPRDAARAALLRSLALTVALALGLLLLGVALVWRIAGRVAGAIGSLAHAAQALGRGTPAAPPAATGLTEIDAVGRALHEASIRLKQREDELRGLNETLERRVAERTRELAAATERLAQARKMEAIGRLTGGVAHDFNNLLAVIVGNLDLLGKRLNDEKLSRYVAHARIAADRGAALTRQLLAFGRRQRMHPQPLELNELIESAGALLSSALGPTVTVRARPGPEPVWVTADREQLEMVIMNLALNAQDAMPEGGEVTLSAGRAILGAPAGPEAPPPGDFGVLSVCDTGVGMTPDVLAQIWEPFFSTKKQGAGAGLGLAQVLGAVQQLGGGVTVQTEPGRGACIHVHLPRIAPAAAAPPEAAAVTPAEAREGLLRGRKVMLVDDDPDVRGVTADLLRDLGCETEELACGTDALARLDAGARPDILVTDYAMSGMTGAEVARVSQERWPDLPVLLISGYLDAEALRRTWNGPVLAKPFNTKAFAARLTQALRQGAGAARSVEA
jgi:signal transduction histidine kinase